MLQPPQPFVSQAQKRPCMNIYATCIIMEVDKCYFKLLGMLDCHVICSMIMQFHEDGLHFLPCCKTSN